MITNFLSGRLRTIANFVPQYCVLADVGCDHGLLSVGLSQHCTKVWAIDASAAAIQGRRHLICNWMADKSHHRLNQMIYPYIYHLDLFYKVLDSLLKTLELRQ